MTDNAIAGTRVRGALGTDQIWNATESPYWIEGSVEVLPGVILTAEPGTSLLFNGNYALHVNGTFMANGALQAPIIVTSNASSPSPGDWTGIRVGPGARALVSHASISYAAGALVLEGAYESAIANVTLFSNVGVDIQVTGSQSVNISGNSGGSILVAERTSVPPVPSFDINVADNYVDHDSIFVTRSTKVSIDGNILRGASNGIVVDATNDASVTENRISDARGPFDRGVSVWSGSDNVTVLDNVIRGVAWGVYTNVENDNVTIARNWIDSVARGLYFRQSVGPGVRVENNTVTNATHSVYLSDADVTVLNTTFDKNSVGYFDTPLTPLSRLVVEWFMHVVVRDENDDPVPGSSVEVRDALGNLVYEGVTGTDGVAPWIRVREYEAIDGNQDGDDLDPGERFYSTPHNVTAWKNGVQGWSRPFVDQSRTVIVRLSGDLVPPARPSIIAASLAGLVYGDVELTWGGSPDEGMPGGTAAYRVLSSNTWDRAFAEVATIPPNGSVSYEYTCVGCGHSLVDTNVSFFRVQAVDAAGNTADSNLAAKYATPVDLGRNLLAVPVAVTDPSLPTLLQTLGNDFTAAWTYEATDDLDPWKAYSTAKGGGDLPALPFGTAFWVDIAAAGVYTVAGLVVDNPVLALQPGWNLVAYGSVMEEVRDVSLAGLSVTKVQTFTPTADSYKLRSVMSNEVLGWGRTYWLLATVVGWWAQGPD